MEQLQNRTIDVHLHGKTITCTLKEKDFGDNIIFEVYQKDKYLFTISKQGEVLFKQEEMNQEEIMDPLLLDELINQLKGKVQEQAFE
jgi:hypothetical protein